MILVFLDLLEDPDDLRIRNLRIILQGDLSRTGYSLGKDIPVQINFLQIGEDSLAIFQDGEGSPDPGNIPGRIFQVVQDQIRKVDIGVITDPAGEVFPCQRRSLERFRDSFSLFLQRFLLCFCQPQT